MHYLHFFTALLTTLVISACSSIDHDKSCDQLLAQAISERAVKNFQTAKQLLDEAEKEAELSKNETSRSRVMRERASMYFQQGDFNGAELVARKLLLSYEMIPAPAHDSSKRDLTEDRARDTIILARSLMAQNRYSEAVKLLNISMLSMKDNIGDLFLTSTLSDLRLEALEKSGLDSTDPVIEAQMSWESDAELRNAQNLAKGGKLHEALNYYRLAYELAKRSKIRDSLMVAASELALAEYFYSNNLVASVTHMNEALSIVDEHHDLRPKSKAYTYVRCALLATKPNEAVRLMRLAGESNANIAATEFVIKSENAKVRPRCGRVFELGTALFPYLNRVERRGVLRTIRAILVQDAPRYVNEKDHILDYLNHRDLTAEEKATCLEIASQLSINKNEQK